MRCVIACAWSGGDFSYSDRWPWVTSNVTASQHCVSRRTPPPGTDASIRDASQVGCRLA